MSVVDLLNNVEEGHIPDYHFADFLDYRDFLYRVLDEVRVSSKMQKCTTYLSKGYDSVACAALAACFGGGRLCPSP